MDRKKFLKRAAAVPLVAVIPPSAFAEASPMPVMPPEMFTPLPAAFIHRVGGENVIEIGYRNAILGYEHVYPTLARAIERMDAALSTKIEWLLPNPTRAEYNYTQILRTPFSITGTERALSYDGDANLRKLRLEQLHRHLADAEKTVRFGKRSIRYSGHFSDGQLIRTPLHTCGGICEFKAGRPSLMVLRDLVLLQNRQMNDSDTYAEEFLSEFSLRVT